MYAGASTTTSGSPTTCPPTTWAILLNVIAQALLTVGVVASLYAGYLYPEYRVTASQLSAVVNGVATLLLFVLIDPQLSVMTDDVVSGAVSEPVFRRTIVLLSLSRIAGTVLAQLLFLPAAWFVVLLYGGIAAIALNLCLKHFRSPPLTNMLRTELHRDLETIKESL